MKYEYNNKFSSINRYLPVAYYVHDGKSAWQQEPDSNGNPIFVNPHIHAELELLLFCRGDGYMQIGNPGETLRFAQGDLVIVNPYEVHMGAYLAGLEEQRHLCVDFAAELLEHPAAPMTRRMADDLLNRRVRCENHIPVGDPLYPDLREAFLGLLRAVTPGRQNDLRFLSSLFRFFDLLHEDNRIHTVRQSPVRDANQTFVRAALEYIGEHFSEPVSTRDIAGTLGYSREHFCRLFKSCFSVPFTDYLLQFRVEKARLLLGECSSSKTAALCGFSSQSSFARVFREAIGCSPSEYRKKLAQTGLPEESGY